MFYKTPIKPFDPVVPEEPDSPTLTRYLLDNFAGAGVDNWTNPPAQDQSLFAQLTNILPTLKGTLQRRWGYGLLSSPGVYSLFSVYQNDTTHARQLVLSKASTAIKALNESGTVYNATVFTPTGTGLPRMCPSRNYGFFATGNSSDLLKWDGSAAGGVTNWGITAPPTPIALGAATSGSITLTAGRKYFLVYQNPTTGQFTDLSPVSPSTGGLTNQNQPLSAIAVSSDAQVTNKAILATADGGDETTLYLVVNLANATTTYTDSMPEATLLQQNVYQEVDANGLDLGVADNTPPPNGLFPTKHNGRLWMVLDQQLYFSKSIAELTTSTNTIVGRYEECWPATNFMDISPGSETVHGLLSDGTYLYIGTERHIRRVSGSSVLDFSLPDIAFNSVGLLNQESWQLAYSEGQPIGMLWMSPDYKVMISDGNTYQDIGTPIQTTLNSINATVAATTVHAMSASSGAYNFYMLFIPTGSNTACDTCCVYDLRTRKWYIWVLSGTDTATASLFNINTSGTPQILFSNSDTSLYQFAQANTQDRVSNTPVNITSTIQTSWLHMGEPTRRKLLNEVEIETGDTSLSVSIDAASKTSDFSSPASVVSATTLIVSPLGPLKVMLGGRTTKDRYYRFTLTSTGTVTEILDTMNIEFYPLHSI